MNKERTGAEKAIFWLFALALVFVFSLVTFELVSHASSIPGGAGAPQTLSYQGRLANSSGTLQSGTFYFKFSIWDTSSISTGNQLWPASAPSSVSLTVTDGVFDVNIGDVSKVLLNNGKGTNVLSNTGGGIYNLTLPPPAGPFVISKTHPDQERWYPSSSVFLRWTDNYPVEGYSYTLSDEPIDIPDNISEGTSDNVLYKGLTDGVHFFHVKALRGGVWGAITDFAVKVDVTPPADFPLEISPSGWTSNHRPLINFLTTDAFSGLDHYEIKIVPRYLNEEPLPSETGRRPFFTETNSPYSTELKLGTYDVIVRAYDKAGNFREVSQRLSIVTPFLQIIGFGFLPRWLSVLIGFALLIGSVYLARRVWQWHREIHLKHLMGAMKNPEIAQKLKQLQDRRSEYLKRLLIVLLCLGLALGISGPARAQTSLLSPPVVTTFAKNISNEEIFYVGGKAVVPGGSVIIYMENLLDGQTFSNAANVDNKGDWFYSFPKFLSPGQYLVWAQLKVGDQISAPSAQLQLNVAQTAIQLGASRISYETLYLVFVVILLLSLIGVIGFILYHGYHGREKSRRFRKELIEAEESVKKGFLLLHRDLQAELAVLNKRKQGAPLTSEDQEKERRLVKDLDWVNQYIEKEIHDLDRLMIS